MIHLYSTPGAQAQAEALRETLVVAYPDLRLEDLAPGVHDLAVDPMWPRWDDLLIVVFADDPLPDALHGAVRKEIQSSLDRGRACRIVPVHTLADHSRPPEPLDAVKSIRGVDPCGADGQAIARRVGALLGLWLRGDDRKVFVSHRQVDGKALAAEVTAHLEDNGYDAWLDAERLHCGDIVQSEIERHVGGAHLLLLLDTPEARHSEWIWREVDAAIRGFVPILPVVLRQKDTSGEAARPGFPNAAELFSHRVEVEVDADGVVGRLGEDLLNGLLVAMEGYLSALLRSQRSLADKVEDTFKSAGFDWTILDGRRQLYAATKPDEGASLTRLLSHCSAVSPRFFHAVRALQEYGQNDAEHASARPSRAINRFNHRLFVYEPPLPRPELIRLARDYGFDQDPILRLIDPGRLATFLNRFQADI